VLSQADYDAWVQAMWRPFRTILSRGDQLTQQYGCRACHSADGSQIVGPTWKGLYGKEALTDGTTVV
jgi:cytochrome c oxidase subunit 2